MSFPSFVSRSSKIYSKLGEFCISLFDSQFIIFCHNCKADFQTQDRFWKHVQDEHNFTFKTEEDQIPEEKRKRPGEQAFFAVSTESEIQREEIDIKLESQTDLDYTFSGNNSDDDYDMAESRSSNLPASSRLMENHDISVPINQKILTTVNTCNQTSNEEILDYLKSISESQLRLEKKMSKLEGMVSDLKETDIDAMPSSFCNPEPDVKLAPTINSMDSVLPSSVQQSPVLPSSTYTSSEYKFNMDTFLKTDTGRKMVQKYNKCQRFDPSERDVLIAGIVRDHLEKDQPMTLVILENISEEIVKKFENEKKEYYFEKYPKACGKLYNKYRSMAAAYKRAGFFTTQLRKRKSGSGCPVISSVASSTPHCQVQTECQSEAKDWLKLQDSPWEIVAVKWRESHRIRREEILASPMDKLLSEWPLIAHSHGHRLIDIDFEELFPGRAHILLDKWPSIEGKLVSACEKFLKFPLAKGILSNLSSNPELRMYDICRILQAVVKPGARKVHDKQVWKVSIQDAWNCFAVEANSVEDIGILLSQRKQFCMERNIPLQPFMVVLKNNVDDDPQFALVADGITYIFQQFLQAFDTYFKLFSVLNLEYPFENSHFWKFIQTFFYEIITDNLSTIEYAEFISHIN